MSLRQALFGFAERGCKRQLGETQWWVIDDGVRALMRSDTPLSLLAEGEIRKELEGTRLGARETYVGVSRLPAAEDLKD